MNWKENMDPVKWFEKKDNLGDQWLVSFCTFAWSERTNSKRFYYEHVLTIIFKQGFWVRKYWHQTSEWVHNFPEQQAITVKGLTWILTKSRTFSEDRNCFIRRQSDVKQAFLNFFRAYSLSLLHIVVHIATVYIKIRIYLY